LYLTYDIKKQKKHEYKPNNTTFIVLKKLCKAERIVATDMDYKNPLRKDRRKESIQYDERLIIHFFDESKVVK